MIRCFCLSAKAMHLRRDVCLRHVMDKITLALAIAKISLRLKAEI